MSKHTEGPWKRDDMTIYSLQHSGWRKGVEQLENRFTVSVHRSPNCTDEETQANARLIAAAPDLLAALQDIVDLYGCNDCACCEDHEVTVARAAITKATEGEG